MDTARLRISTRLILGFTLMMSLLAALGAATLVNVGAIDDAFELALNERYPKIKRFLVIKDGNATVARALRDLFIVTDPAQVQSLRATIAEVTRRTQVELEALQRQISPAGKAGFDKLLEARAAYSAPRDRILELLKNGDKAEAARVLVTEVSPRQADYMKAIDGMVFVGDKLLESAHREASEQVRTGRIVVVSVVGLAFFVAVGTSVWLIRSITRPVGEAVRIARRVADGDLTTTFEVRGPAETAELLASLKEMQRRLAAIVGDVRHGADGVATASGEIASGNDDLSTRTESQASALQQTSSSMEQLSSTVRANADSAEQANQLALAASAVATRGGAAVQEVVTTMRGISHSSGRIAEIIGTIDGIAFQTNILALNAAVEAARAGEQGRGFAVVASEVRTLAQRSAAAAKEIKGLISQSTERVQTGTEQVDQAGATIEEVVRSIRRVTEIVGEISAASREQHAGVDQVGRVVVEMDRSTQQNAALVEQSAAAAQSLKQQAQQLLRAVAVFKTRPEAASV